MPSGQTVVLPLADARLLVDACWRIARARGITGSPAASVANKLAAAQAGDLAAAIDTGELRDLSQALERLGLSLRLTPALIELQAALVERS
jgi:sulfur relay (sulfurtransferase) complex TusBCD TusD component (DsrE family)